MFILSWMRHRRALPAAMALAFSMISTPVLSQGINLVGCEGLWFSTEEDFLSRGTENPGGQVVSDGDLLTYRVGQGARVCARNQDLLRVFDTNPYDLGLDALDQIEISPRQVIAAFSTELDSVNGAQQFTAGDLLFTNGQIIPNVALLARFGLPHSLNLGLDAVYIDGDPARFSEFLEKLSSTPVDDLRANPDILTELLQAFQMDIWFSTEGTPPDPQQPAFIDGDLLSARDGIIVRSNADMMPVLPAGIPARGVDYGMDAFTPAIDPIEVVPIELFSIEIQARDKTVSDGDVLQKGPAIYLANKSLINNLEPLDNDMGLDALAARNQLVGEIPCDFRITSISHVDAATRINSSTGLFDTDRPFGGAIRVQGVVPGPGCKRYQTHEFQVRVSLDGAPEQPIAHPASLNWMVDEPACAGLGTPFSSDPSGWFSLTGYQRVVACPNDESLAVWLSTSDVPGDVATADLRIAMQPIGGAGPVLFSPTVRVKVDNKKPQNVTMALFKPGETEPFGNQCKIDGEGEDVIIDIRGTFDDDHFRSYSLSWNADGNIGGAVPVTMSRTYNSRPELTDTGTLPFPGNSDALLEQLNLTAVFNAHPRGGALIECGYSIRMVVYDRTRLGRMNWRENAFSIDDAGNRVPYLQSFCLTP